MDEKTRLLEHLFGDPQVTHKDVKFLRGDLQDVTEEQFCQEVSAALVQKKLGMLQACAVPRSAVSIDVKEHIGAL